MKTHNQFPSIDRKWRAVWRKLDDVAGSGGYPDYGWDYPTLSICYPEIAAEMRAIKEEFLKEVRVLRSAGLSPMQTGIRKL